MPRRLSWQAGLVDQLAHRPNLHLFLDFDGTLAPIAPYPDDAFLPDPHRVLLERLIARPRTRVAIVSGRHLDGLVKKIDLPGLDLIGNHGSEWRIDGVVGQDETAARARPAMARIAAVLAPQAAATPGVVLEQKGSSLSLHVRMASPSDAAALGALATSLAAAEPDVHLHGGHGVVEVRPKVGPNKGTAILALLRRRYGDAWAETCAAVFVGDDRTDEDGFLALGELGFSVRVGSPDVESAARYEAASVDDVVSLLTVIAAAGA